VPISHLDVFLIERPVHDLDNEVSCLISDGFKYR
jgi:hypothetical protein